MIKITEAELKHLHEIAEDDEVLHVRADGSLAAVPENWWAFYSLLKMQQAPAEAECINCNEPAVEEEGGHYYCEGCVTYLRDAKLKLGKGR